MAKAMGQENKELMRDIKNYSGVQPQVITGKITGSG